MPGESIKNLEHEAGLIHQEVVTVIEHAEIAPPLKEGVLWQLRQKGKSLFIDEGICWSVLPLLVCEAICGSNRQAVPVAAAVELVFAAGDVFDDIQDHELEESLVEAYGPERALNVAIALLMLSQRALVRLREQGVNTDKVISVMEALSSGVLRSCAGQHRDLAYEREHDISAETYLEMIGLKSAPLVEMTCRMGALTATDDAHTLNSFGRFGWNLGMAFQIINDVWSIGSPRWSRSDISKKKKTLPIIFAFNHADREQRRLLDHVYDPQTIVTQELQQEAARVIMVSGGVHYSMVMVEKYKGLAAKAIESETAGCRLLTLL